ncbi:TraG/VirB4 family ATPase [Myxococcus vastator]|uniref:TraG/VirB4 family ATPase n=1 Tax=Myxococcus vastator TaxID=2709664 RepID=UPI0013D10969|nr:hypothetical protein [Myxococcus vastator]
MPRAPRPTESAFAHWLPYWWAGDGVLVLVDGTLVLGWRVRGCDASSSTDDVCNTIAHQLRSYLNALPVGSQLQLLRRSTSTGPDFAAAFLRAASPAHPLLKMQRDANAEHLLSRGLRDQETYLFLSLPQALGRLGDHTTNGVSKLLDRLTGRVDPASLRRAQHMKAVEDLRDSTTSANRHLIRAGVVLEPLADGDLVSLAFRFLNPGHSSVPELVSDSPPEELPLTDQPLYRALSLREQLVHSSLSWNADTLYLGMKPHRILSLKAPPARTRVQLIQGVVNLPFDYWLSVAVHIPDTEAKYGEVEKRRNRAKSMATGYVRDVRASTQAQELEGVLEAMTSRDQRVLSLSVHVLYAAEDLVELDRRTQAVLDAFNGIRTPVAVEYQNQLHAYLGMLPGNAHAAPHRRTVLTDNAADFLPVYAASQGAKRPLFAAETRASEPLKVDIASPAKDNWNFTLFGASGSGKSFFTGALLTSSMLGLNSPVIIVDVGGKELGSYYRLCELLGGDFIDVNLDGGCCINPFPAREDLYCTDEGDPAPRPNAGKVSFLANLTRLLVTEQGGGGLSIAASSIIEHSILATYARLNGRTPIFTDVAESLDLYVGEDHEDTALAKHLAKTLRHVLSSSRAKLFNAPSRVNIRSNFIVFDMKGLEALGEFSTIMLLIVSSFIWSMLGRRRTGDGWLAWVLYDECWKLLQERIAAKMVAELFATIRKLKGGVGAITQNLDQALSVPEAASIFANAPTTFLLKHVTNHEKVSNFFQLNSREQELFRGLTTVKGSYSEIFTKWTEGGVAKSTVLRYAPSACDYWLMTTDPKDRELEADVLALHRGNRLAAFKDLVARYPNGAASAPAARAA